MLKERWTGVKNRCQGFCDSSLAPRVFFRNGTPDPIAPVNQARKNGAFVLLRLRARGHFRPRGRPGSARGAENGHEAEG